MIKFYRVVLVLFIIFSNSPVTAQQFTFFESFDETEPGTLPAGWSAWQNEGGGNAPSPVWRVLRDSPLGVEQYVMSSEELGRDGLIDEDWLITPRITPKEGDFLIFSTRRGYEDTGDSFKILISTSTDEAPDAFTEPFASYAEIDMPNMMSNFSLD